ncbi:phage portal protein [Paenibacillus cymbidii]|uniref:phage portal protein n=1 Tax=Paenibacillus cymbidii TaxID=1639034 RepID=UPI0010815472|nr:phage portal protein [Paenibacillus cymbidii]
MGLRSWVLTWLEAGRPRKEPERMTEPFPYAYGRNYSGNKQSAPKKSPANMRLLSESPIPRRAINIIKDGITKLNWTVTAVDKSQAKAFQNVCEVITNALLRPNPGDSFRTWLEQIVEDMLVASAGSSEVIAAGDPQRPFRMYPTDTFSIELFPYWDGRSDSDRYAQRQNGKLVALTDSEMMYIRMNPRTNTPFGLSPLETVWESVNNFIYTHRTAGKEAGNPSPRDVLNIGEGATANDVKAYRAYWENEVRGQGVTPIIGGKSPNVLRLGANDDSALFIGWQRFLIEIVAIAFGVSPKKLGQTKDVNRNTADSEDEDTDSTVFSVAENIVEHINRQIIEGIFKLGGKIEFKFLYATSLKDQRAQADIDAIYLDRGVDTIDEVRDNRGKDALPNGHGQTILLPSKNKAININKTIEQLQQEADAAAEVAKGKPPDKGDEDAG